MKQRTGRSYAAGIGGGGFAREPKASLRGEPRFFSWNIGITAHGETPDTLLYRGERKADEIIDRRTFSHGTIMITGLDYWPSYLCYWPPYHRPQRAEEAPSVDIECSEGVRFYATFSGV